MTEEKVKKGKELLERLNKLKDQKSRWERGVCFFIVEISDSIGYNGAQHTYSVDDSFINFDEVKLLAIKAEKEANQLREQALTPAILEKMWIEKWDGKLPVYGQVPTIFKDISK